MLSGKADNMIGNLKHLPCVGADNTVEHTDHISEFVATNALDANPSETLDNCQSDISSVPDSNIGVRESDVNFLVIDGNGNIVPSELKKATDSILHEHCSQLLNYDRNYFNESSVDCDNKLVNFVLDLATRNKDGRLVLPLLWNHKVSHLLGKNENLSKLIVKSNFRKYYKDGKSILMIDEVFKEQERLGIIKKMENLPKFLEEHPNYSFIPHMPIFRMDKETSKCRNVFLSNLSETDHTKPMTISHNQVMVAGPCLNKKISTTLLHLRFDKYLLGFDLKKTFLQIELAEYDQEKLLLYWYRNVSKEDFNLVVYKHVRLPFGLRPSPALLLLGLYKILILDTSDDSQEICSLKTHLYDLLYMENCAISFNDPIKLTWAYEQLENIFSPYRYELQQFVMNHLPLQEEIDRDLNKCSKHLGCFETGSLIHYQLKSCIWIRILVPRKKF